MSNFPTTNWEGKAKKADVETLITALHQAKIHKWRWQNKQWDLPTLRLDEALEKQEPGRLLKRALQEQEESTGKEQVSLPSE